MIIKICSLEYLLALYAFHAGGCINNLLTTLQQVKLTKWYLNLLSFFITEVGLVSLLCILIPFLFLLLSDHLHIHLTIYRLEVLIKLAELVAQIQV